MANRADEAVVDRRRRATPTPYNFRRPDKFSRDHIRSIQTIQEGFRRFGANVLAATTRAVVQVSPAHVEQSNVGEYLDQLLFPTVLFMAALEPLVGKAVIELDLPLAEVVVDRMLGGPGLPPARPRSGPTEVETQLLEDVGQGLFDELVTAWEQVTPLRAGGCELALSPLQVRDLIPGDVALLVRHEVRLLETTGWLTICLPASMVEPLLPRLNARLLANNPRPSPEDQSGRDLEARLEVAPLTVRVELGRVGIRVAELLSIAVGDVIRLDTAAGSGLPVLIEDRPYFLGHPGQRGGQLAIRIVDLVGGSAVGGAESEGRG